MAVKMSDKTCSREGCGNHISTQNKTGVCTPCQQGYPPGSAGSKAGKKKPRATKPKADVLDRLELGVVEAKLPKAKSDAQKRFRVVAEAMGHDPEALLNTYCEGWLAAVKQAVDTIEAPVRE